MLTSDTKLFHNYFKVIFIISPMGAVAKYCDE